LPQSLLRAPPPTQKRGFKIPMRRDEWPQVRERIKALELDAKDLLK
jgi:hypothetical protein